MREPLIQLKNLTTRFFTPEGVVKAVEQVSFGIEKGRTWGFWASRAAENRSPP